MVFLTTREAYAPHYVDDRKHFEPGSFYHEFAKPWQERRLPMRYEPRPDAVDVCRAWHERNGGNKTLRTPPPGNQVDGVRDVPVQALEVGQLDELSSSYIWRSWRPGPSSWSDAET